MFKVITIPFGYLLDWLNTLTGSYGISLILFSLILKLLLLGPAAKSKKSMLKMSRLSPRLKALEIECGEDKQKLQQETAKLYKEEGVSMFGGCLWSFVPLLILIPLYYVIREPITYLMHYTAEEAKTIVEVIAQHIDLPGNAYYHQLVAAPYVMEYKDAIAAAGIDVAKLHALNFKFLGIDLGTIPDFRFWTFTEASQYIMLLFLIVSAASQLVSALIAQKMSDKIATNNRGEQEENATAQTGKTMMWMMPLMSLYFCFIMPAAMSVYWTAQAVLGIVQDVFLTLHFRKVYEEEDRIKRETVAAQDAAAAERERIRAERIAQNGGETWVDPNTSKKKMRQKAQQAAQAEAAAYAAAQSPVEEAAPEEDKHFSGDPERPYCRGRAYKPNRYGRKDAE